MIHSETETLAQMFPNGLFWCVDEFQTLLVVDRFRGWCPHQKRYRYVISIPCE